MAQSIVNARDGIVGPRSSWETQSVTHLGFEDPKDTMAWPGWARSMVIHGELMSGLRISTDGAVAVQIAHRDEERTNPCAGPVKNLATIKRPSENFFKGQMNLVLSYADLRVDRLAEIVNQTGYPDHYFGIIVSLHPDRTKRTLELLGIVQRFATAVVQNVKMALACKRPDLYSASVQPAIPMPGHGALPSGHATEAAAMALMLTKISGNQSKSDTDENHYERMMMLQAERIAVNRTVAGLHFPADSISGAALGLCLAEYFEARAQSTAGNPTSIKPVTFDAAVAGEDEAAELTRASTTDYSIRDYYKTGSRRSGELVDIGTDLVTVNHAIPQLAHIWKLAKDEWK